MRIFRLELKRVLKSRLTWTLLALALILSVLLAWLPTTYCYSSYTDEVGNEVNLADTAGQAEISLLLDKKKKALVILPDSDRQLIDALFTQGLSEREWSALSGIPQKTINDRKKRLLLKLRKIFEK